MRDVRILFDFAARVYRLGSGDFPPLECSLSISEGSMIELRQGLFAACGGSPLSGSLADSVACAFSPRLTAARVEPWVPARAHLISSQARSTNSGTSPMDARRSNSLRLLCPSLSLGNRRLSSPRMLASISDGSMIDLRQGLFAACGGSPLSGPLADSVACAFSPRLTAARVEPWVPARAHLISSQARSTNSGTSPTDARRPNSLRLLCPSLSPGSDDRPLKPSRSVAPTLPHATGTRSRSSLARGHGQPPRRNRRRRVP